MILRSSSASFIHVDGLDSPNVQMGRRWKEAGKTGSPPVPIPGLLTYEDYLRREASYDEVQRTIRLHGHFHEDEQSMMFPIKWLTVAMDPERWATLGLMDRHVEAIGIDVAAGGRDNTCWTLVDDHGVIDQIVLDLSNTMEIVGRTIQLMEQHKLPSYRVAIDAGGGGKQIADRLSEQDYPVQLVGFAESPVAKQTYTNRRVEMYGLLRNRLNVERGNSQFMLPPDAHQLRSELVVLPLSIDSEGKYKLPPKRRSSSRSEAVSIEQLLGRSPDRADSLALAVWILDGYAGIPDDSQHVYYDEDWDRPLTAEEWEDMPAELREICEMADENAREAEERKLWGDDWW